MEEGDPAATDSGNLAALYEELLKESKGFRREALVGMFNAIPLVLQVFIVLLVSGLAPFLSEFLDGPEIPYAISLGVGVVLSGLIVGLFVAARSKAVRFSEGVATRFSEAKKVRLGWKEAIERRYEDSIESAEIEFKTRKRAFEEGMKETAEGEPESSHRYSSAEEVEKRAQAMRGRLGDSKGRRLASLERKLKQAIEKVGEERDARIAALDADGSRSEADLNGDLGSQFRSLVDQWETSIVPKTQQLALESKGLPAETSWLTAGPDAWQSPDALQTSVTFGELHYSAEENELKKPASEELRLPSALDFRVPLRLRIPDSASVLLETKEFGREEAISVLNSLSLSWLAGSPPGRLSFSFFDPVGLGESFAGLMHLADYEEVLINSRIRTQDDQIEQRLGELCEHMEKVIQMYLRSDFETITQYNEAAGTIAERYHFVVIADFPRGFTELAAKRLASIAASGARCGVFLLIHSDLRAEFPQGFAKEDLRKACLCLRSGMDGFFLENNPVRGTQLTLFEPPESEEFARWVHRIGEANRDSNRIEVPFSFIAPAEGERWSGTTASEVTVPIGRSGATKLQELALGKGTCQHALIAGKTGSGKSTLFHVIVTNLALWCDPDEVEFYLIDFKKG
ncbi:MAG: FtsK/SpoIIIE domain-containing protein, partial [Verrucomicrobiota bacterium]